MKKRMVKAVDRLKQPLAEVFGFPINNPSADAVRCKSVFTRFDESLEKITRSEPGDIVQFVEHLQEKVDEKLEQDEQPDMETIDAPF